MTRNRSYHPVTGRLYRLLTTMLTLVGMAMLCVLGVGCELTEGTLMSSSPSSEEDGEFVVAGTVTLNTETIEGATVVAFTNDQEAVDDTVTNDHGEFVLLISEDEAVTVVAGAEFNGIDFIASTEMITSGSVLDLSLSEGNATSQARLTCWQAGCWWRFVYTCCDAGYWGPICSWGWGRCN